MNNKNILIVDGDSSQARTLTRTLRLRGFEATSVRDPAAAVDMAQQQTPAYIVLEQNFPGVSGLAFIKSLRAASPQSRVLVLTSYATIENAVKSIKLGAWNYMAKPAYADEILAGFGVDTAALETQLKHPAPQRTYSLDDFEWSHILRALNENGGNVSAAARALKMHRRTLQRKLECREEKLRRPLLNEIRANGARRRRTEKHRILLQAKHAAPAGEARAA